MLVSFTFLLPLSHSPSSILLFQALLPLVGNTYAAPAPPLFILTPYTYFVVFSLHLFEVEELESSPEYVQFRERLFGFIEDVKKEGKELTFSVENPAKSE